MNAVLVENSDLRRHLPVGSPIAVLQLYVGLLVDAVQVLMETIKQEGQQLLGVLLLEAVEPRRVLCYRPLRSHRKRETFNKGDGERERLLLTLTIPGMYLKENSPQKKRILVDDPNSQSLREVKRVRG